MKQKIDFEEIPPQFVKYLEYVKSLDFKQTPDYAYLKSLF